MRSNGVRAVFLDVGGTLIAPHPSVVEIYMRALEPLGLDVPAADLREATLATWAEFDTRLGRGTDRFSYFPGGEREYWTRYIRRVLERLARPERSEEAARALIAAFTDPRSWSVFPEVDATLRALEARGVRLGLISNWDSRLRGLLEELELARRFESITISCEVGREKPDSAIFEAALGSLGVRAHEACHVGDDRVADYEGARAAGLEGVLLVRAGAPAAGVRSVKTLLEIVPIVCDGAGGPPEPAP